jgi:hypothetical protein
MFEEVVAPWRQETEQLSRAAQERGIAAATREFGASVVERGDEWSDEIQAGMAKLVGVVRPASDDVTIQDYLSTIYDVVSARTARQRGLKTQLSRLKSAKETAEPTTTARPGAGSAPNIRDLAEKDAIAAAVAAATKQLGG